MNQTAPPLRVLTKTRRQPIAPALLSAAGQAHVSHHLGHVDGQNLRHTFHLHDEALGDQQIDTIAAIERHPAVFNRHGHLGPVWDLIDVKLHTQTALVR